MAVRREGRAQLVPPTLVAMDAPRLNQFGDRKLVFDFH